MDIDIHGFGRQLQTLRLERGFTQEELSERASLGTHYVGNLEQGTKKPSLITIMKLCSALGTTPDYLFKDSISADMLDGISVPVNNSVTLRDTYSAFYSYLSSHLEFSNPEDFCPASSTMHPLSPDSTINTENLSDLLFQLFPEPEDDVIWG